MADARVPIASILDAFGLPVVVTLPDGTVIPTTGVWLPQPQEDPALVAYGGDRQKVEPRRLMTVPRSGSLSLLQLLPRGTRIVAAEELGLVAQTWQVDGQDRAESDQWTFVLSPIKP